MPSMPSQPSPSAGYAPRPLTVEVTGKRSEAMNSRSSFAASPHDAAARVHDRPARVRERLGRQADLLGVALGGRLVTRQPDLVDRRVVDVRAREVLRNVDQNRPGTTGAGDVERGMDGLRDLARILDLQGVLDDR